jgi:hypothetical protein
MSPDEELMVIFGALHVVALALGALLFYMFLRSDTTTNWRPPDEDDGGGGAATTGCGRAQAAPHRRDPAARRRAVLAPAPRPGQTARRAAAPRTATGHPPVPAPSRQPARHV